jgi:hypothetical protein
MFAASHHSSRIAGLPLAAWIALAAVVGFAAPVVIDVARESVAACQTRGPSPSTPKLLGDVP